MAEQAGYRALRYLRKVRRRRRLGSLDTFDIFYRFYLVFLFVALMLYYLSRVIDAQARGGNTDAYLTHGAAAAGLVVVGAIAIGMRSGSRGGPLLLEPSDIHQILLAPIERATALRGFAFRQLQAAAFWGMVVGGVLGLFALSELPGAVLAWVAGGAGLGAATAIWAFGVGFLTAGFRLPARLTTIFGAALILASALHLVGWLDSSPGAWQGRLALIPLQYDPVALLAVVVATLVCTGGIYKLKDLSVEAASYRSALMPRLRLAMAFRDIRTMVELRRLLAGETPRHRPLIRLRSLRQLPPVWARAFRSVLRWPGSRFVRVASLGAAAGLASVVAWELIAWFIIVAGLLMFVAALDAIEPLAQEFDHPERSFTLTRSVKRLVAGHLSLTVLLLLVVGALGLFAGALRSPKGISASLAITTLALVAPASATAALLSVALEPPPLFKPSDYAFPPEAQAIPVLIRQVSRPSVALLGFLPLLAARYEQTSGDITGMTPSVAVASGALIAGALVYAMHRLESESRG